MKRMLFYNPWSNEIQLKNYHKACLLAQVNLCKSCLRLSVHFIIVDRHNVAGGFLQVLLLIKCLFSYLKKKWILKLFKQDESQIVGFFLVLDAPHVVHNTLQPKKGFP